MASLFPFPPPVPLTAELHSKSPNSPWHFSGEDMDDKETHAVSVACCRGRPPSSSHFRVSEQQRNDCLFSPSAPAGACSGLSSGPWRPGSSLPGCLPPSCCQWGATSPPVPPFNTVHCMLRQRRSSALEKRSAFELRLQMLQLQL